MSRVQEYKCEVCGLQELDHTNWLLVSDQPRAHNIDILRWDDKLAAQPGICHLCCANHLQVLVSTWMMPDLGIPAPPEEADAGDISPLSHFNFDRACSTLGNDREAMLAMLDAVEAALQGSQADEPDAAQAFDA